MKDPHIKNNSLIFSFNGDFYFNGTKPNILKPTKSIAFQPSNVSPLIFVHEEVFNSLLRVYLEHDAIDVNVNPWEEGMSADGIEFNSEAFGTFFPKL